MAALREGAQFSLLKGSLKGTWGYGKQHIIDMSASHLFSCRENIVLKRPFQRKIPMKRPFLVQW